MNSVQKFDDLIRSLNAHNQTYLEEFLRFATSQEDCRLKWLECVQENRKMKRQLDDLKKENINLSLSLTTARKLFDLERVKKHKAEEEKFKTERQLQMVRDLLFTDNRNQLHDETKEKLKFLNSTIRSRFSNDHECLSAINEMESTGSILSDLSYSRSEDDLDLESMVRKKKSFVKHRPSTTGFEEPVSVKRRRSTRTIGLNNIDGVPERMVATTTVTMEHDGSMSAQSQIETVPTVVGMGPTAPLKTGSFESIESGLSLDNNIGFDRGTPRNVEVLPVGSSKINTRNHTFASKTAIRPEECDVCEKRVKFGCNVLRCLNCRGSCHAFCKDGLPLPCIAAGNTPISKKNMGIIADYAPPTPPLVPGIIIHLIKEIESRGLKESGIYRVPGSEKDVRALQERLMKNKGVPRLTFVDIHAICGCLKSFLRNLKEPLVTHSLWWKFADAVEVCDLDERRRKLYQLISELPMANRDTLAFVILHLLKVAEAKDSNKMSISNLATILSPAVVGYSADYTDQEAYVQTFKSKVILEQLLSIPADYWYRIMSSPVMNATGMYGTPRLQTTARSQFTPSSRSFKRLFENTPSH